MFMKALHLGQLHKCVAKQQGSRVFFPITTMHTRCFDTACLLYRKPAQSLDYVCAYVSKVRTRDSDNGHAIETGKI